MLIKTFGTAHELQTEFIECNRDNFSFEGYEALLDLFDEIGENTELDVVGIDCQFTEYNLIDYIRENITDDEAEEILSDNDLDSEGDITIEHLVDSHNLGYDNNYLEVDSQTIITF